MAKTPADHIAAAQDAFEAGFASMAAKKRAQDELSRAFRIIRDSRRSDDVEAVTPRSAPPPR